MCRQFVGVINGELVCHTGVIAAPMQKNARRLHRSVVLPDYQGIGIGMNFKNAVCDILRAGGWGGANLECHYNASTIPCTSKVAKVEIGALWQSEPARIIENVADGYAAAHHQQLVNKPHNIFVSLCRRRWQRVHKAK